MGDNKKLILIDGNAIIHRAFHAIPPFRTSSGELVNSVYGFASILLNLLNNEKPDYIAVAFDLKGKTFRHEEYKEYKATRTKAPDELYGQIPRIHKLVSAFKIPIYTIAFHIVVSYTGNREWGSTAANPRRSGAGMDA